MDENKTSGISIECVHLLECEARLLDKPEKLDFNMIITRLARKEEGNQLFVEVSFDMMGEIEHPACILRCTFGAQYSRNDESQMTWRDFSDGLAVMHMVPFVREFVSSVTLRMPLPALILQPTNVNMLVADYKLRKTSEAATKVAAAQN